MKSLTLSAPVEYFGRQIAVVHLRPPRGAHLLRFGMPRFLCVNRDGASWWVEKDEVIASYLDALVSLDGDRPVEAGGTPLLNLLSLADSLALRDALFDFFSDAQRARPN